jgi:hypothetical protein
MISCPPTAPNQCGNVCVDFTSDNNNCGGCGMVCPAGVQCTFGVCSQTCGPVSCAQLGAQCGQLHDACGNVLDCGICPASAGCTNNQCLPIMGPWIELSPTNGPGGTLLTVQGHQFTSSMVNILFDAITLATAFPDPMGYFSVQFTVPQAMIGPHMVVAQSTTEHASATFNLTP